MNIEQTKGLIDRMSQIKSKAREMGIDPEGKEKIDLIHEIQRREGFSPCFGFGMFTCSNLECCWRQSCCEDKC